MANFARIINSVAVDVSDEPSKHFHPSIAEQFVSVPDNVQVGWRVVDGVWSAPVAAAQPGAEQTYPTLPSQAPVNLQVGPVEFRLLWTIAERLTLKSLRATDMAINDFFDIIEDQHLKFVDLGLASTQRGVDYCLQKLVETKVITASEVPVRRNQILTAHFQ